ncbi:GrpB family protein [Pelagibius sp. Alg239-R121]|uniref:GrpB family protein n=1 Tax=Pelagibius sp. Alg239-R121 TaxID=2993448 RepID=UPI0024A6D422|nr:GrpB family protein [Pelagibius sp. Alg239-R121]
MLTPFEVQLEPHDLHWSRRALDETAKLKAAIGENLLRVHHVGSTSIPGIMAKPIIDLLPIVADLELLDGNKEKLSLLGYEWKGELGLPGRRYCFKNDPVSGKRLLQLHCYQIGSPEITRHLAFRDYLIENPEIAQAYEAEKLRCQTLHRNDHHAYGTCKSNWIDSVEADALSHYAR